jgi:hypothetical protein
MSAVPNEVTEIGSESDTLNSEMKTRRGVVRGRTPKVGKTKRKNTQLSQTQGEPCQLYHHYEEETEAGERIPSSPQTEAVPEHPPSGGKCEETAPHLAI